VVGWRRLQGGISSAGHRVSVEDATGRHVVILRQWVDDDPDEADRNVSREVQVLAGLAAVDLPVPRLLASATSSEDDFGPCLLMTRVPGRIDLAPAKPEQWIRQMAAMLARIHELDVDAPARGVARSLIDRDVPPWANEPSTWRHALDVLRQPPPPGQAFVHGDYQHFNLLWRRGTLTGVVDWTWAGIGVPDGDVGHCRLNLAALYTLEWAEQFRLAYESETGRRIEPWWDLYEISKYSPRWPLFIPTQVAGRAPVDTRGMQARVEDLLAATLRRC
jgi:aminoglycoside phosphotransferase (APT) family kinase protein